MDTRPNLLLLLTDQQSAAMMSCAGNPWLHTPAMDGLAARGLRFEQAYCTNPVCIASRFSLFTGRMPSAIGMLSNRTATLPPIPPDVPAQGLGHRLRAAGYRTAYAGKVHLPRMTPVDVGFEVLDKDEREGLARTCADFLRQAPRQPFCLVASFINPHDICYLALRDFAATEQERFFVRAGGTEIATLDAALARPAGLAEAEFFATVCPPLPAAFEPLPDEPEAIAMMLAARPFRQQARSRWDERRWREHRWAYARLTERVDAQIGTVLAALAETGLDRRTLIVFTSDHGDMDAAHRLEHKSTLYDQACRVPLLVCPPAGAADRVDRSHLVSNGLDLLPTLCDYAGAEPPPDLAGQSWRPLLEGREPAAWRSSLPLECAIGRAVLTPRWKYAAYDLGARPEQLFDRQADPDERRNLAAEPAAAGHLAEQRQLFAHTFKHLPRSPEAVLADLGDA